MDCEVQGIDIYYEVVGEGQPIVMLHGGYIDHRHMVMELEPLFEKHQRWQRIYPDLHYEFPFDVDKLPQPFEKPMLIIVGKQDSSVGYRDAWKMMDHFPRATFAVLDNAGHFLGLEQEGLFRALAEEWLQRVEENVGSR